MTAHPPLGHEEFFGTTTIGEKGQIVIPAEAREALKLEKKDKLLVFGMGEMLVMSKIDNLETVAAHLSEKLAAIRGILKKTKK